MGERVRAEGLHRRSGKSRSPDQRGDEPLIKEGAAADQAVSQQSKRTQSRRELARHEQFDEVSPEVGELDEDAFDDAMADDGDAALALLADLVGATDQKLRDLARRLAGRIVVDLARRGRTPRPGVGKLSVQPMPDTGGDLDFDASLDGLVDASAARRVPRVDELRASVWRRPDTALCLIVDRSGSMHGAKLATAAVAAAAVAHRVADYSVLAFSSEVIVAKSQTSVKAVSDVVDDLLRLRGHGTTDLALALRTAHDQLSRSRAARKVCIVLSDCRATVPGDVESAARSLEHLCIVAPREDAGDAEDLARSVGARLTMVDGPMSIPDAFSGLLD